MIDTSLREYVHPRLVGRHFAERVHSLRRGRNSLNPIHSDVVYLIYIRNIQYTDNTILTKWMCYMQMIAEMCPTLYLLTLCMKLYLCRSLLYTFMVYNLNNINYTIVITLVRQIDLFCN